MAYVGDHHCAHWSTDDHNGNSRGFRTCKINPGHRDFMTIQEFRDKGASLYSNEKHLNYVWNVINRTVRVRVSYTSKHRPDTYSRSSIPYPLREYRGSDCRMRSGTGYLYFPLSPDGIHKWSVGMYKTCPCLDCSTKTQSQESNSNSQFSAYFIMVTATHVIFDSSEADKTVFEFDYDDDDRKRVRCVYGVGVGVLDKEEDRLNTDWCPVVCVTHDEKLADYLRRLCECEQSVDFSGPNFMVSHPHGVSKRISFDEAAVFVTKFAFQKGEFPITLMKGLPVRVSGSLNNTDMVTFLNRVGGDGGLNFSDSGEIGTLVRNADEHKSFRLSSDITISFPFGIILHTEIRGTLTKICRRKWWTIPEDTQFISDSGLPPFSLPHSSDHDRKGVKFEFYIKDLLENSPFLRTSKDNHHPTFEYKNSFNYTMAACPGSSGAYLQRLLYGTGRLKIYDCVHFGLTGKYNRTGLGKYIFERGFYRDRQRQVHKRTLFERDSSIVEMSVVENWNDLLVLMIVRMLKGQQFYMSRGITNGIVCYNL